MSAIIYYSDIKVGLFRKKLLSLLLKVGSLDQYHHQYPGACWEYRMSVLTQTCGQAICMHIVWEALL